ncbi:MAG: sigma-70 family RNA polymerase sigma factor [Deltaproteobacteria bacterium]|jgi:RNA polymerase sigma factor (sigma-70 family)
MSSKYREDEALVARVLAREDGAHDALVARLTPVVQERANAAARRFALTDDRRDDLVQELWVMLGEHDYRVLRSYAGRSLLTTFTYAIATRFFFRRARKLRDTRIPTAEVPTSLEDPAPSPLNEAARRSEAARVREVVEALGDDDRFLLHMFYEQDATAELIGRSLGISAAGVRMKKRRLLAKLGKKLAALRSGHE